MIGFDTNILVYAQIDTDTEKHFRAINLLYEASASDACIPVQVLSEFLNVCLRKLNTTPADAVEQVEEYCRLFIVPPTNEADLINATDLCVKHKLQFFDALIITVASRAGATMLLSEDMHDGLEVEGLRVVNPFVAANEGLLADYFISAA